VALLLVEGGEHKPRILRVGTGSLVQHVTHIFISHGSFLTNAETVKKEMRKSRVVELVVLFELVQRLVIQSTCGDNRWLRDIRYTSRRGLRGFRGLLEGLTGPEGLSWMVL
jgi:hypothetical protein